MGELVGATLDLLQEGDGVTTSGHGGGTSARRSDDVIEHGEGATGEGLHLEDALRAVPEDSLRARDDLSIRSDSLRANIETEPALVDALCFGAGDDLGILGELVGADEVGGQVDSHAVLGSLGKDVRHQVSTLLVIERGTNGGLIEHLVEGESHATANDHLVDDIKHVHDKLNLVLNLCAAHDDSKGAVGALEHLREVVELLLEKEASSARLDIDTDHRAVSAMARAKSIVDVQVAESRKRRAERVNITLRALHFLSVDNTLALFSHVESKVLKKEHLAIASLTAGLLDAGANAVVLKGDLSLEQVLKGGHHR
mmetsp:Transcript_7358/g.10414  ORF Transcript_7358/g.10414 Transcript_7358/m.10414 type:complete len:313 (+) Transcript_7358:247-1185(+)